MKKFEKYKRLIKVIFSVVLIAILAGIYGMIWIGWYNKIIWAPFFRRGNWMMIFIYAILLIFFMNTYGGFKVGFLKKGNTTLMIGVEDEKVEEVISLIKQECGQHQKLTVNMPYISGTAMVNYATMPMTVEVGGATIFVINVDHYEKI